MRNFLFLLLLVNFVSCSQPNHEKNMTAEQAARFDWQGHRGARGLLPENTVPSFLKALEYPEISTLELDLAVSQDRLLVVSHEPWMSHHICSHPDGRPVEKAEEDRLVFFQMPYALIRQYDCGSRGNERFPRQQAMPAYKPLLSEVVEAAEAFCIEQSREQPRYNIEIKIQPSYDGVKTPGPEDFARLVLDEIERLGIKERACVQSFDVRPLQALHRMDSSLYLALLIDNPQGVDANLKELGFTPQVYSPYYQLVTDNVVKTVHARGMKIIPWTVNDTTSMKALIALGVDGIITDYPDLIEAVKGER
jgi:glycerophosphoryl diester phosphodiesterase